MQYLYLTSLEVITLILTLFIGTIILYFLIRVFNKTIKFLTVLKAILFYELCAIIVYLIHPESIFLSLTYSVLKLVILGIILFLIFYFITKKYFIIDWKKSLIVFSLMTLILFPLLDFFRVTCVAKIENLPVFASVFSKENSKLETYIITHGFKGPLSFEILGKIEGGIFSWPGNSLRQIIIQIGNRSPEEEPEYYVKVISPNGGEKIEADQPLRVEWDSKNIGAVNLSLLSSNNLSFDDVYVSQICSKVDASLGYCQGTLKDFHATSYYKIRIEGYREKSSEELSYVVANDESDNYFSIVKTGKFTFPIGGENFIIGEKQKITWQMPNGNIYYNLDINLLNERGEKLGSIINWNWVKYDPVDSIDWDAITIYNPVPIGATPEGQTVYELKPDENIKIQPGNYKLILRYEYSPSGMQGSFESNYFKIID